MLTIFLFVLIAAVVGSAGMVGVLAWIHQRLRRLESGTAPDSDRLLAENADLRDQLEAMRSDLNALDERVDFTERLLEGRKPEALPEPDAKG